MSSKGLVSTGKGALPIANDVPAQSTYRASVNLVPPQGSIPVQRNESAETLIFVEAGTLQMMVGGVAGYLSEGEFARVAIGVHYAYRNAGYETARVMSLPVIRTEGAPSAANVIIEIAAA